MNRKQKFLAFKSWFYRDCCKLVLIAFALAIVGSLLGHAEAMTGIGMALFLPGTPGLLNATRFTDQLTGINGVNAGGVCTINLDTNKRYHRISINVTDAAAAVAVSTVVTQVDMVVSGVVVRSLTARQIVKIAQLNGFNPQLGEIPIFFSEPWTNINEPSDITSWDMTDQGTFQIRLTMAGGTVPGVTGWYEYDYQRNGFLDAKGAFVPKLQVVKQNIYTFATAAAQNIYTSPAIPINFPIRRMLMDVAAGTISAIQIKQDNNIVAFFSTNAQMVQAYRAYGFKFSQTDVINFQNATGPANLSLYATLEALAFWSGAVIFDVDQRLFKSLKVAQNLTALITTSNATTLTLLMETVPGAFA